MSNTELVSSKRIHKAMILIVDDMELNRALLKQTLELHGYNNVLIASNGTEALQLTRQRKPDLVILDLMMPGMDGFSYCVEIRKDYHYADMPIIVQTALDHIDQKIKAFQLGASDYICKPVDPNELGARIDVHLRQKMLLEELRAYHARTKAELNAARQMQDRLMPSEEQQKRCEQLFGVKVASFFESSFTLGGDGWGMRALSESRLAIYMYDFSGHGLSAAMNVFRLHTIIQELMRPADDPGEFLGLINRHMHQALKCGEFATMFYGIIDIQANCLLYASAGIPSPVLYSCSEDKATLLDGRGFPLGALDKATYKTQIVPFLVEDILLLYSDCLIETKNTNGDYINEDALQTICEEAHQSSPTNPAHYAVERATYLLKNHNREALVDDLTINAYWRMKKTSN